MSVCAYCNERRAVNQDHVIPRSLRRNHLSHCPKCGRQGRQLAKKGCSFCRATVPSCFECNMRKGARRLIPPSWADLLDELNNLGIGTFRVWDGSVEALHEVVK